MVRFFMNQKLGQMYQKQLQHFGTFIFTVFQFTEKSVER